MKPHIKQLLDAAIHDNKSYIKAYTPDGNIKEYFEYNFCNEDQGHCWYLTDEEIVMWENSEAEAERLTNEIHDLLYNYNTPIEQYLGEKVEPAY